MPVHQAAEALRVRLPPPHVRRAESSRVGRRARGLAAREKGVSPCPDTCPIHGPARRAPMLAELAAEQERSAWEAASAGAAEEAGADERTAAMELASMRRREADAAASAAAERATAYDSMSKSEHHLRVALLPCGKQTFNDMNVTGTRRLARWATAPTSCGAAATRAAGSAALGRADRWTSAIR
mmetsp:Transcript_13518/g.40035  ORF Transcript_13518/g.40035 Transcript_13518/m.40035 type:complete len:184 (-) Transcript_13518:305-856(-)